MKNAVLMLLSVVVLACTSLDSLKKDCDDGLVAACESACEKGELGTSGCLGAATAYREGQGVAKNEKRALSFMRKACDSKSAEGCHALGDALQGDEALAAFEKACDYGRAESCSSAYDLHYQAFKKKHEHKRVPRILAVLKKICGGPLPSCGQYTRWLSSCADATFFYDGITGLKCRDAEPKCAAQKKLATRPFCSGEKPDEYK